MLYRVVIVAGMLALALIGASAGATDPKTNPVPSYHPCNTVPCAQRDDTRLAAAATIEPSK